MTRWNEIKVHVTGVPLSSAIDCRLGSVVVPSGCDDGCSCSSMERQKAQLVLFQFGE